MIAAARTDRFEWSPRARGAGTPLSPVSVPKRETNPASLRVHGDHEARSPRRAMSRMICSPQVRASPAWPPKRSWLMGMRYSATHPSESTAVATSHTAFHESSSLPSSKW